jgi:hypothetical protein
MYMGNTILTFFHFRNLTYFLASRHCRAILNRFRSFKATAIILNIIPIHAKVKVHAGSSSAFAASAS